MVATAVSLYTDAASSHDDSTGKAENGLNHSCTTSEEDFLEDWRAKLCQEPLEGHGKDGRYRSVTRAGRTLRNNKYRRVVEGVQQKKQLFTPEIKKLLKEWLLRRRKHPYPSRNEKKDLVLKTGLTYMQICNWFANWRRKLRQNRSEVDSWGRLIAGYNRRVGDHCETFSISSEDSVWDEANYNHSRPSGSSPQSTSQADSSSVSDLQDSRWVPQPPDGPATSALVKWLESAARFRPRESHSSCRAWAGHSATATLRRPRGKLRRQRQRKELDAAEALTYLSVAATMQS